MRIRWWLVAVSLSAVVSVQAAGLIKPRNLAKVHGGVCAVALGPDGAPHVAYQSPDYHLYHAWLAGTKWLREPVDTSSDCGWGKSIAVDAAGRAHVTYTGYRDTGSEEVLYAVRDAAGWQSTTVGVAGTQTHLCLDADARPHILFSGTSTQMYARLEGGVWQVEDTGVLASPYAAGFVLDGAGKAHVSSSGNYAGCYYGTNATGTWQSTLLVNGTAAHTAIALDSDGRPGIAVALPDSLRYFRFDGTQWGWYEVWNAAALGDIRLDGVSLALSPDDRIRMLLAGSVGGALEVALYSHDNGIGVLGVLVDTKNAGFYPSLALGPDGRAHGTYCSTGGNTSAVRYVAIALPDLAGTWASTALDPGATTFTGTLRIQNTSQSKSLKTTVAFALSDNPVFDGADAMLDPTLQVKSLKPGAVLDLSVRLTDSRLVSGKHLIAIIDPAMASGDADATDNLVPALLP